MEGDAGEFGWDVVGEIDYTFLGWVTENLGLEKRSVFDVGFCRVILFIFCYC